MAAAKYTYEVKEGSKLVAHVPAGTVEEAAARYAKSAVKGGKASRQSGSPGGPGTFIVGTIKAGVLNVVHTVTIKVLG